MYGTAVNLAILALGAAVFAILLVTQTISTEFESPSQTALVASIVAFATVSIAAMATALVAWRAERRAARAARAFAERNRSVVTG